MKTKDEAHAFYTCVTGQRNERSNRESEDTIKIDRKGEILFYGLADGQSGKEYSKEGGNKVLEVVFNFIAETGISKIITCEYIDEFQFAIIKKIRDCLSELSIKRNVDNKEFASTVMAFAYDKRDGNYLVIHLGDGCIIGAKEMNNINMISAPENGLTKNYTWLTTSSDALHHIRFVNGNIKNYHRIVMCTDGVCAISRGRYVFDEAKKLILHGKGEDIIKYVNTSFPEDDASCIVIDFDKC